MSQSELQVERPTSPLPAPSEQLQFAAPRTAERAAPVTPNGALPTGVASTKAAPREAPLNLMEEQRRKDAISSSVIAARTALRRGQKEAARDKLKEAFELSPTDAGALELLGDIFMEEGEQEKALRVYERGLEFHPRQVAFEEKIALAYLDLGEMQRDADRRKAVAEGSDPDKLLERNPKLAMIFSLIIPGSGQYYNGDGERAGLVGGAALTLFLLWCVPLYLGISALAQAQGNVAHTPVRFGSVLAGWPTLGAGLFWMVLLAWVTTHILAARDAWTGALHVNEGLKFGASLEV